MSKLKTSIPLGPGDGAPNSGARYVPGKSSDASAVLRKGLQPKSSPVAEAKEIQGAAARCIKVQVDGDGIANGDPHKRSKSVWGKDEK